MRRRLNSNKSSFDSLRWSSWWSRLKRACFWSKPRIVPNWRGEKLAQFVQCSPQRRRIHYRIVFARSLAFFLLPFHHDLNLPVLPAGGATNQTRASNRFAYQCTKCTRGLSHSGERCHHLEGADGNHLSHLGDHFDRWPVVPSERRYEKFASRLE